MEFFFSEENASEYSHIVIRKSDIVQRHNFVSPENTLQLAGITLKTGEELQAHVHLDYDHSAIRRSAQEAWVVISGKVRALFFNRQGFQIGTSVLQSGDCAITLMGGHKYICESDALVYEFKTGPYFGAVADKIQI